MHSIVSEMNLYSMPNRYHLKLCRARHAGPQKSMIFVVNLCEFILDKNNGCISPCVFGLGDTMAIGLYSDASAAIAISQRTGLGKLRHIQTQYLWIQERVAHKEIGLQTVLGTENPADLLTKHLPRAIVEKHLEF